MIEGSTRGRRRGLFREFFVVMFGVLVALGLEQLVSDWQEGRRAQATLEAMHEEFRDFAMLFRLRQQTSPCATAAAMAMALSICSRVWAADRKKRMRGWSFGTPIWTMGGA